MILSRLGCSLALGVLSKTINPLQSGNLILDAVAAGTLAALFAEFRTSSQYPARTCLPGMELRAAFGLYCPLWDQHRERAAHYMIPWKSDKRRQRHENRFNRGEGSHTQGDE
jgi:hypothetical protein